METDLKVKLSRLKGSLEGEIEFDPLSRSMYSTGACLYRVRPQAIVFPKSQRDVVLTIDFARQHLIPVTARGGGTSRTGNELGEGIVLDFSRHMNKVLSVEPQERYAVVEPGVILSDLNEILRPFGLFFPPDPSTKDHCTIGGMIANNSSGPMSVKYGTTRRYVESVELVLSNGEVITTGPMNLSNLPHDPSSRIWSIHHRIKEIVDRYREPLAAERPHATKDSSGYHLWGVVNEDGAVDLTPLIVGSEGTLGIVTRARLRLMPLMPARLSALVYFGDLGTVGDATQRILRYSPSMVEIMERSILDLARSKYPSLRDYLPEGTEALLVVELEGEEEAALGKLFLEMRQELTIGGLARDLRVALDPKEAVLFSKIRTISGPILNTVKGSKKPRAFIEDPAVHPSRLPEYIQGLRDIFARYGVDAAIYGHAGDGNLHSMVALDLTDSEDLARMVKISSETYELVLSLRGTISGEHGDGRLRSQFLALQYPRLKEAFVEVKEAFDPEGILNPGIIVPTRGDLLTKNLRFRRFKPSGTELSMAQAPLWEEIQQCSGCGKCRSYCPVARVLPHESATARGKIALVRDILEGELPESTFSWRHLKRILDLCMNCKRCLKECPSGVDGPGIVMQGRAQCIQKGAEELGDRILSDPELTCSLGALIAPLSNMALKTPLARRLAETLIGLDRQRPLPSFSRKQAKPLKGRSGTSRENNTVAVFLTCQDRFTDARQEANSAAYVLQRNGFEVIFPKVRCCAISRISSGAAQKAKEDMTFNVKALAPLAQDDMPILFTEPSCLLAVKKEYPKILGTESSAMVGQKCLDIHDFLLDLHQKGRLNKGFGAITMVVAYHRPCHSRALGEVENAMSLLRLIPGLEVIPLPDLCCGMGGTFGLKKKNATLSRRMGGILAREIANSRAEVVVTTCSACKMQISEMTGLKVRHPISILHEAYRASR